ncbi:MAG: hypothetical protein LBL58_13630 [Tannerellaceae bacterium]|jgi:hypothetical protein|nr:hypothetical protein [Tannerellaceae bacterium]
MDENEKLLDLFDKYKNDLSEMNRDEVERTVNECIDKLTTSDPIFF